MKEKHLHKLWLIDSIEYYNNFFSEGEFITTSSVCFRFIITNVQVSFKFQISKEIEKY